MSSYYNRDTSKNENIYKLYKLQKVDKNQWKQIDGPYTFLYDKNNFIIIRNGKECYGNKNTFKQQQILKYLHSY